MKNFLIFVAIVFSLSILSKEAASLILTKIEKGSLYEKIGLKEGDLLVSANNIKLSSIENLSMLIEKIRPGQKLDLLILRGSKELHFQYKFE